jgi:predicted nucleic acid-binding protein
MILVDTPVWSLALRRRPGDLSQADKHISRTLYELIQQGRVQLLGSTRQELLSGIRDEPQFNRIRDYLREFPNVGLDALDYEEAARISNECRGAGIAASPVDMLICAVSVRRGWEIFTMDRDFVHYRRVIPLRLLSLH